jgi:CRISPR type I-E-associated protein CasA/Cse1
MHMQTQFDLFNERFLPWRDATARPVRVGLREALTRARDLAAIGDAGPQTTFAVVRLLLVLMHWTRPTDNDQQWQNLWDRGHFPDDWLAQIETAAIGKFDLFDAERPFLQGAPADEETRPVSDLIAELPAATNINHSRHACDDRVALCPACCGLGILRLAPFCGQGGQGKAPSINAPPPVYLLPVGDTLFRTLLLNWPLENPVNGDHPAWDEAKGRGRDRVGLLEGLTWEPRSVRLIPVDAQGEICFLCGRDEPQLVRRIVFQKGRDRRDPRLKTWRDPHVAYAEEKSKTGVKRVSTLLPPEPIQNPAAASRFWREVAAALLCSGHGHASAFSSAAVATARRFRASDHLNVLAIATHTRQAKVLHDHSDPWTVPPPEMERDHRFLRECEWLSEGVKKLEKEKRLGISTLTEFERRAERHFRALLAGRSPSLVEWRAAVLADLSSLARPVSEPGQALDHWRAVRATEHAINTSFPMPEATL